MNAKPKAPGTPAVAVKELVVEVPDYTADQLQRERSAASTATPADFTNTA